MAFSFSDQPVHAWRRADSDNRSTSNSRFSPTHSRLLLKGTGLSTASFSRDTITIVAVSKPDAAEFLFRVCLHRCLGRIHLVGDAVRKPIISAAIRAGLVDILITDEQAAVALLG